MGEGRQGEAMGEWNDAAVAEAYRRHAPRLLGTALRLLRQREDAEDTVQDAFIALVRTAPATDAEGAGPWLHRVVVNAALDRLRTRKRWRTEAPEDAGLVAPTGSIPDPRALDLARAVERLPERARLVFLLHDVEGLLHEEVGAALGIDAGTSKSQLARARSLLRAVLGGRP
jgi:RNA polymerase sigma-70 factor (ECF subfamily)